MYILTCITVAASTSLIGRLTTTLLRRCLPCTPALTPTANTIPLYTQLYTPTHTRKERSDFICSNSFTPQLTHKYTQTAKSALNQPHLSTSRHLHAHHGMRLRNSPPHTHRSNPCTHTTPRPHTPTTAGSPCTLTLCSLCRTHSDLRLLPPPVVALCICTQSSGIGWCVVRYWGGGVAWVVAHSGAHGRNHVAPCAVCVYVCRCCCCCCVSLCRTF